jgi:excisionase family DNA binding protein
MELNVRDVASILRVPEYTIYRLIDEDDLPASQINGQYRFSREELLEWASARSVNPVGIVAEARHAGGTTASLTEALRDGGILKGVPGADKDTVLRTVIDKLPLHDGADRFDGLADSRDLVAGEIVHHHDVAGS